jgi:hypothetical protein
MFPYFTRSALFVFAATGLFGLSFVATAEAQSVQSQCSVKYKAAKAAGTLDGQSWNQFYHTCAADLKGGAAEGQPAAAATAEAPAATPTAAPAAPPPATPKPKKTVAAPAEPSAPAPEPTGSIVFPTAIDPKYSTLTPHLGREKTCGEQFRANKVSNSNGGLKWNPKGGGYYSLCNKKLKGEA